MNNKVQSIKIVCPCGHIIEFDHSDEILECTCEDVDRSTIGLRNIVHIRCEITCPECGETLVSFRVEAYADNISCGDVHIGGQC